MNAIVAVCRNWGIGYQGALLVHSKVDMHRFVELTMGGTVVMGRKTLESFPGGPLKGRRNVVISHDPSALPEGRGQPPPPRQLRRLRRTTPTGCGSLVVSLSTGRFSVSARAPM